MYGNWMAKIAAMLFARTAIVTALITASPAAAASCARPDNIDLSLGRESVHGIFRVEVVSGQIPIPMSKLHQWSVRLSGADGNPIAGATIEVDGGMPEHGHGLPTVPRAEAGGSPGTYVIKGMKFSMPGWWELKLDIRAPDGRTDKVTFNLVL